MVEFFAGIGEGQHHGGLSRTTNVRSAQQSGQPGQQPPASENRQHPAALKHQLERRARHCTMSPFSHSWPCDHLYATTCMHVSHQALAACSSIAQLLAGQRQRFHFSIFLLSCECVYVCNTSVWHFHSTQRPIWSMLPMCMLAIRVYSMFHSTHRPICVYANVQTLPCDQWVASGSDVHRQGTLADRIAISAASAVVFAMFSLELHRASYGAHRLSGSPRN